MKKHIALGIAAAVLGASGVASAVVSYDDLTSAASSQASVEATSEHFAADCSVAAGNEQDAHCTTSVAGVDLPALPNLPAVPDVGLDDVSELVGTAEGAVGEAVGSLPEPAQLVGEAKSLAGEAQALVAGAVPVCNLPIPVQVPVPASVFSAGMALFHQVENLVMDNPALNALPPVHLPVGGLPTADGLIDLTQAQVDCLAEHFGGELPIDIPAVCSIEAGAPSAVKDAIPAQISGLFGTVAEQLAGLGLPINIGGSNIGASCDTDAAAGAVSGAVDTAVDAVSGAPSTVTGQVDAAAETAGNIAGNAAGTAGNVAGTAENVAKEAIDTATGTANETVGNVTGQVGAVTDTVTETIDSTLDTVTGVVNGLVPSSTPECEASANASGGLLGGLTAVISGGCK